MNFLYKWFVRYWRWTWGSIFIIALLWWSLSGGSPATPDTEVVASPGGPARFVWGFIFAVVAIGAYRWTRGEMPPLWFITISLSIPLFLYGCWAIQPEWYGEWRGSRYFWWMILTAVGLGWLSTHRNSSVVRVARWGLLLLVAIAIGIGAYNKLKGVPEWFTRTSETEMAAGTENNCLPADVALPIIAKYESGGRQFDDKGELIKNPKSSAIGKYQILASLHEERAKSLGMDIRTEEGNEQYARLLYAESCTKHWEADWDSRKHWEPELVALGYQGASPVPPSRVGKQSLSLAEGKPVVISLPPGHKWELVGKIPTSGWTTNNGYRDARGNRIQIFEVVAPMKAMTLEMQITRCASCAW